MAAGVHHPVLPAGRRHHQARARTRAMAALLAAEGAALAVVLAADGSPPWRAVRAMITLTAAGLAVWLTRRGGRAGRYGRSHASGWTASQSAALTF